MTWAAIAAASIGAGGAFGSAYLSNQGGGETGQTGAYFTETPMFDESRDLVKYGADYTKRALEGIESGQGLDWYNKWSEIERAKQKRNIYEGLYGNNFNTGSLETLMATDVDAGRMGGSASKNVGRLLSDAAFQERTLDDYLMQLNVQTQGTTQDNLLGRISQYNVGIPGQWNQYSSPYQQSAGQSLGTAIGSMTPWLMDAGSALISGLNKPQATSDPGLPGGNTYNPPSANQMKNWSNRQNMVVA